MPKLLPQLFVILPHAGRAFPSSLSALRRARLIIARRSSGRYLYLQFRDRRAVRNLFVATLRANSPEPVLPTRAEGTA